MASFADKYPWAGWTIIGLIEAIALAVAIALCHFGYLAWYLVPLSLLALPVVAIVALFVGLIVAMARGENPFQ